MASDPLQLLCATRGSPYAGDILLKLAIQSDPNTAKHQGQSTYVLKLSLMHRRFFFSFLKAVNHTVYFSSFHLYLQRKLSPLALPHMLPCCLSLLSTCICCTVTRVPPPLDALSSSLPASLDIILGCLILFSLPFLPCSCGLFSLAGGWLTVGSLVPHSLDPTPHWGSCGAIPSNRNLERRYVTGIPTPLRDWNAHSWQWICSSLPLLVSLVLCSLCAQVSTRTAAVGGSCESTMGMALCAFNPLYTCAGASYYIGVHSHSSCETARR